MRRNFHFDYCFFQWFFNVQRIKQIELIQCKNSWNKIQAQYIASVNSSRPKQDINGRFNLEVINKFSCLLFLSSFEKLQRRLILTATSALVRARYHPSQCQILTLATDGQVSYFEVIDGTEIRNIVLGKHSTVTSLDVSPGQGENFITSTNDSLVKVIFFFTLTWSLFAICIFQNWAIFTWILQKYLWKNLY